ncbi:hypothetical protein [Kitasatospora azatica]|uniref:hypothetical protein n=1 Tax=Kitasatospora azatica TaxID=58347 RepID=UPI00056822ED|nr:hypothetical protein [Kitasatospora azatica]
MADNETPIAAPEQTDELDDFLVEAVQPTAQAADQHTEPGPTPALPSDSTAVPTQTPLQAGDGGTAQPTGSIINTH